MPEPIVIESVIRRRVATEDIYCYCILVGGGVRIYHAKGIYRHKELGVGTKKIFVFRLPKLGHLILSSY